MACIFTEGFDKYGPLNSNSAGVVALLTQGEWTTALGSANGIVAPLSVTGQAFQVTAGVALMLSKTLSTNYPRLIGGIRFSSSIAGTQNAGVGFFDGATAQCSITVNTTTGTISLRTGASAGTALATSSISVSANTTHYLEWDITFAAAGAYQVWLDGVSLFSGTGNTKTTANTYANVFGLIGGGGGTAVVTYDDLYLFDTSGTANNAVLLTSPRVETTFPTSDSAVQFTFQAGILGNNALRTTTVTGSITANSLFLRRFVAPVAGTLASVGVMPGATSGTANFRGVVYGETAGVAGTLLSSGTQVTGVTNGTAAILPLTTPQALTAGTAYWVGYMNDTTVNMYQNDTTTTGYRAIVTYASGAPATAPAMGGGFATVAVWGNLTGITGNNWYQSAQQPPPGSLSYVFDPTVGHEDLYNFGALSVTPSNVYVVAVKGYLQRSDSGARTASLRAKSGASDGGGSITGITPATTFGWVGSMFELDPQTGAAWTGSGLNAAQSGVKVDT